MDNKTEAESILDYILEKLFSYVGEPYSRDYCTKTGWQSSHTWSSAQHSDFHKWLVEELYTNHKKYKKLFKTLPRSKTAIERAVCWLMLDFSWKVDMEGK